jgi:hypothetical protein
VPRGSASSSARANHSYDECDKSRLIFELFWRPARIQSARFARDAGNTLAAGIPESESHIKVI